MLDYNLISMTMKKFQKIYIGAFSTLIMLSACNKELNLKPYQQIDQGSALQTAQDVQITLVGAYNRMSLEDLYGGGIFLYPDLLATQNEITWQGTFQGLTQMTDQTIPNDNSFVNAVWLDGYQVINAANNVLANVSKVSAANVDRTTGEAKFLRGLVYFDLARLFGRAWNDGDPTTNLAVPLVTTPTQTTAGADLPRSTVATIYSQAIADLTDAENKLPASNSFFANKYAASAILARLYLQQGNYANAAAEAGKVISSGAFQLNANYADEFPYPGQVHVDNTSEDIFAIQITSQTSAPSSNTNYLNTFYASSDNAGRGDIIIKDSFVAGFEPGDTRLSMYNDDSAGILRCDKFDNVYGNVHVVRLAEMYLIRAEANLRISAASAVGATPTADLNVIRERAGLADVAKATIANVLTERVHELAFEGGFFLHDAKRTGATVTPLPYNSPKLVFPIPLLDINANPKLVQNPGY
jgi:tetratricopeptide (TPR) repeat protein